MDPAQTTTGWFWKIYGSGPRHLLVLTGCFLLTGYTLLVLGPAKLFNPEVWWQSIGVWFLGGAVFLDFVLLPLCASADRGLKLLPGTGTKAGKPARHPFTVNYVRIPLLASGLLFLLFFPGIIEQGKGSYLTATGQTQDPFLERWLWLTALFCVTSAIVYVARSLAARLETTKSTQQELRD